MCWWVRTESPCRRHPPECDGGSTRELGQLHVSGDLAPREQAQMGDAEWPRDRSQVTHGRSLGLRHTTQIRTDVTGCKREVYDGTKEAYDGTRQVSTTALDITQLNVKPFNIQI